MPPKTATSKHFPCCSRNLAWNPKPVTVQLFSENQNWAFFTNTKVHWAQFALCPKIQKSPAKSRSAILFAGSPGWKRSTLASRLYWPLEAGMREARNTQRWPQLPREGRCSYRAHLTWCLSTSLMAWTWTGSTQVNFFLLSPARLLQLMRLLEWLLFCLFLFIVAVNFSSKWAHSSCKVWTWLGLIIKY